MSGFTVLQTHVLSQFSVRQPFLSFKGNDAPSQPAQARLPAESLNKDTFDTALKQLSQGMINVHGKVSVSPEIMADLNQLLAEPRLDERQERQLTGLFNRVATKLLNKLISGKLTPAEESSLWFVDPKNLNNMQALMMDQIVTRVLYGYSTLDLRNKPKKREAMLTRLMALAKPFNRESMVYAIRDYKPFTVTNGIQHDTLTQREGTPLSQVRFSTFNLEHFNVVELRQPNPFAFFRNDPPTPALLGDPYALNENERQVVGSVSKMRCLAEVLKEDPSDVVILQEVRNVHILRSMLKIHGLSERYPNILFYPAQVGTDGLAILTSAQALPRNPKRVFADEAPRPSAEITLDLGNGQLLTVFNVHFKADNYKNNVMTVFQESMRLSEAAAIGKRITALRSKDPTRRFIVAGDFNTDPTSDMQKFQQALGLQELLPSQYPPTHKNGHLDWVFLSPDLLVSETDVVGSLDSVPPPPSDHLRLKLKITTQK